MSQPIQPPPAASEVINRRVEPLGGRDLAPRRFGRKCVINEGQWIWEVLSVRAPRLQRRQEELQPGTLMEDEAGFELGLNL